MDFHLQFPIPPFKEKITYEQQLLFTGSCFAEHTGEKLQRLKFNVTVNPSGILYNPFSIAAALESYMQNAGLPESALFFDGNCWSSWQHHSRFSHPDKAVCLDTINASLSDAHAVLKNAEWLFITFGSAFVYRHRAENKIVANCHKLPQKEFEKSLCSAAAIVEEYSALIKQLKDFNSRLKIVLTVSPVRYMRDGVVENTLSKAMLIQAVHELAGQHAHVFYFPAYELVTDDLRDYRFYQADLVHPNGQAIAYVFEKLAACSFADETKELLEKVRGIIAAKEHRPLHADTAAYARFRETYLQRVKTMQQEHPYLDLAEELEHFSC